ncbi:MAG: non-canonical purine NTP pyrophosphatase, partial [Halobacteriaceae archaeon]
MLRYVTTNEGKVLEAREYLDGVAAVEPAHYDYVEVQADDLETIARRGARDAHRALGEPVLVDDSGLFVAALDGFPGPYSSYVEDTLGIERVQRLVAPEDSHRAQFRCTLAYAEGPEGPAGLADRPGTAVSGEAAAGEAAGRTGGPDGDAPGEDSGTAGDAVFV